MPINGKSDVPINDEKKDGNRSSSPQDKEETPKWQRFIPRLPAFIPGLSSAKNEQTQATQGTPGKSIKPTSDVETPPPSALNEATSLTKPVSIEETNQKSNTLRSIESSTHTSPTEVQSSPISSDLDKESEITSTSNAVSHTPNKKPKTRRGKKIEEFEEFMRDHDSQSDSFKTVDEIDLARPSKEDNQEKFEPESRKSGTNDMFSNGNIISPYQKLQEIKGKLKQNSQKEKR
jgi:hypothetical protein